MQEVRLKLSEAMLALGVKASELSKERREEIRERKAKRLQLDDDLLAVARKHAVGSIFKHKGSFYQRVASDYDDVSVQLLEYKPAEAQLAREPMENDEQSALLAHARQVLVKHLGQKLANRILLVRGDNPSVHGKHNPKTGQTMLFPEYIGAVRDADGNVVMSADEHLLAVAWHELLHRGATVVGRSADGQPLERGGKAQSCPHLGAKHQSTIRKTRQNLDG